MDHVLMQPPDGGEPKLVPAVPEEIIPLMVQGWRQVEPPNNTEEKPED
jgi:hypothetical protein